MLSRKHFSSLMSILRSLPQAQCVKMFTGRPPSMREQLDRREPTGPTRVAH
jgi:hypothetical protein